MKDFIQRLQTETPKAWFEFVGYTNQADIKEATLLIDTDGVLEIAVEIPANWHDVGIKTKAIEETRFAAYEGFLNSFIESEGYYTNAHKIVNLEGQDRYKAVWCRLDCGFTFGDVFEKRTEAKQSAIEEAFKLIEKEL